MATPGWLNSNLYRAYPFVEAGAGDVPQTAFVEAGFIAWPESGYVPGTHSIWLDQVTLVGGFVVLTMRSDAPGLVDKELYIPIPNTAAEYSLWKGERNRRVGGDSDSSSFEPPTELTVYSFFPPGFFPEEYFGPTNAPGIIPDDESSSGSNKCLEFPLWEGFVVIGDMGELLSYAVGSPYPDPTQARFEPCLTQSLTSSVVTSINLANGDRTRADPAEGCVAPPVDLPGDPPFVVARCLTGDVRLEDGFNLDTAQSLVDFTLVIGASRGAGAGLACEEIPVYPGEDVSPATFTYDGAPVCSDVVVSVNGLTGPHLNILARPGTKLIPDQDNNTVTLVVDVGLAGFCDPGE